MICACLRIFLETAKCRLPFWLSIPLARPVDHPVFEFVSTLQSCSSTSVYMLRMKITRQRVSTSILTHLIDIAYRTQSLSDWLLEPCSLRTSPLSMC